MKKLILPILLLITLNIFAQESDSYQNEDFIVDPKIKGVDRSSGKKQLGEANHATVSPNQVLAGDRFEDIHEVPEVDREVEAKSEKSSSQ